MIEWLAGFPTNPLDRLGLAILSWRYCLPTVG